MKKIKINRSVFSDQAIKTTVEIYKDYADISLKNIGEYVEASFWQCKYDEVQTIKEFENYMIGIENS